MRFSINSRTSGKFKQETINGRNHIVTTMMPIAGDIAMNKMFYPNEQVKSSFDQLNNLPAPNGHPKLNGVHVTAFSPLAMNAFNVGGFIRNPKMKGKKVFTDFVIDETVANTSDDGREIIRRIKAGETVGVSTGLNIAEVTEVNGKDDHGQEYNRSGAGFSFDHVAILLNEKAAGEHAGTELILNTGDENDPIYVVNLAEDLTTINELSVDDITLKLEGLISSNNKEIYRWVLEVFPESKTFIWQESTNEERALFKQTYSIDDDKVLIVDGPVKVELKKEYPKTTNQEGEKMNKDIFITLIIACVNNSFTDNDKTKLNAMNESELVNVLCSPVDEKQAKEVLTNCGFDFTAYEEFTVNKSAFDAFQITENVKLANMQQEIVANSDYTPELLKGKSEAELKTINGLIEKSKLPKRVAEGQAPAINIAQTDSNYSM